MMPLLVLRPEPGAERTAERAQAAGFEVYLCPLFTIEPVPHDMPDPANFDAVFVTSPNGVRHGSDVLRAMAHLPMFVVGEVSEQAVRAVGATHVTVGGGDAARTLPLINAAGHKHVLHLCGADVRSFDPGSCVVTRCVVYRSAALSALDAVAASMIAEGACVLIHSPRAGALLAEYVAPDLRSRATIVAISNAAAQACGNGWAAVLAASVPTDQAMLALARQICHYDTSRTV